MDREKALKALESLFAGAHCHPDYDDDVETIRAALTQQDHIGDVNKMVDVDYLAKMRAILGVHPECSIEKIELRLKQMSPIEESLGRLLLRRCTTHYDLVKKSEG